MKTPSLYNVIGLMSGTSLDGLDVAYCRFRFNKAWSFQIVDAKTYDYSLPWRNKLSEAHNLPAESLQQLHAEYGNFLGSRCLQFIRDHKLKKIDFIASHGHTIFHQPENGFTFQLGDGSHLHAVTGLPVVFDFRSLDVALGGQGAPLVPMGDKLLFSNYEVCLNLGGIANLSMTGNEQREAFDVCFCNMPMNHLVRQNDQAFDRDGKGASSGSINLWMLAALNKCYALYRKSRPSLTREMFNKVLKPILDHPAVSLEDKLRTLCESITDEIVRALPRSGKKASLLATGGGALNTFLIGLLSEKLAGKTQVIVPQKRIIEFKEAMVFAFLGLLCVRNEINVLKSVTKARQDSCTGIRVGFS